MKRLIVLSLLTAPLLAMAQAPIVKDMFTADPAPLVVGDTLFLYTGHDDNNAPKEKYVMKDWLLFSTTDMVNWEFRGTPLKSSDFSWSAGDANAAQCIERNGKFYWYVSVTSKNDPGVAVGVAVSDYPTGPFKDAIGKPLIINSQTTYASHSWDDLDPTVFIDDDGQAYLYWGNNALYCVKLNEDMISYSGEIKAFDIKDKTQFGVDFEEAPWFYKRKKKYYMVYASGLPESIHYAMSNSPMGPWSYQGVIMETIGNTHTNHPGIVEYKGKSYFFYHDATLPNSNDKRRNICVEKMMYDNDGTIMTVTPRDGITKPVK